MQTWQAIAFCNGMQKGSTNLTREVHGKCTIEETRMSGSRPRVLAVLFGFQEQMWGFSVERLEVDNERSRACLACLGLQTLVCIRRKEN